MERLQNIEDILLELKITQLSRKFNVTEINCVQHVGERTETDRLSHLITKYQPWRKRNQGRPVWRLLDSGIGTGQAAYKLASYMIITFDLFWWVHGVFKNLGSTSEFWAPEGQLILHVTVQNLVAPGAFTLHLCTPATYLLISELRQIRHFPPVRNLLYRIN